VVIIQVRLRPAEIASEMVTLEAGRDGGGGVFLSSAVSVRRRRRPSARIVDVNNGAKNTVGDFLKGWDVLVPASASASAEQVARRRSLNRRVSTVAGA